MVVRGEKRVDLKEFRQEQQTSILFRVHVLRKGLIFIV